MKAFVRICCLTIVFLGLFAAPSEGINWEEGAIGRLRLQDFGTVRKTIKPGGQARLRSVSTKKLRLDSILILSPDTATMLISNPQKYEIHSDTFGRPKTMLRYTKDDTSQPWDLEDKTVFYFDEQGRITSDTLFTLYSATGQWDLLEIHENRFDANDRLLMESTNYYHGMNESGEDSFKNEYQYDSNGKMIGQIRYTWSKEDVWVQSSKRVSFSDGSRDTAWHVYAYSSVDSSWSLKSRELCQYDSSGHCNLRTIHQWVADSLCWSVRRKIDYAYDALGNKVREYSYDLDLTTHEWIQDAGGEWSYDVRGNMLTYISSAGKDSWIFWGVTTKNEYQYDFSILSSDVFSEFNPIDTHTYNLVTGCTFSIYMPPLDSWYEANILTCYYSDMEVSTAPIPSENPSNWYYDPNAKLLYFDKSINLSSIKLFDMQGCNVRTTTNYDSAQLSLNGLTKGVYVIRAVAGGRLMQGKVLVE